MANISVKQIVDPTDEELDSIVSLVVRAFDGQNVVNMFTGNNLTLAEPLWRAHVLAGLHHGEVWVATDGTAEIMSVGVWFLPGHELYGTEELEEYFTLLSDEAINWWRNISRPKVVGFFEKYLGEKTRTDNWFAQIIATHPDYERRGLASAHIDAVYHRAVREESYLALGAAGKAQEAFYRSNGFKELGRVSSQTADWVCFVKGKGI
ncbi:uncharacterized protein STEHIDRAFT_140822 [Stereum hirsutum FP-91666 SS1]|uniref:uncharacterized protein n=1 Tax=Stereum hirsutum (strain FP-91666) TaxID=721885 RepID=UPI0004449E14|nr:uncharacterized protein STEHIDRAFT_140822 [Stereum hirsutum FP-91666 SS1]EIM83760.1 hypothetical protein STEHIDRAFT_140822 [Stereum hirsutum FP-91666 SS1]